MTNPLLQKSQIVYIVDDDEAVRDSLRMLLRSVSLPAECFPSAQAFLDKVHINAPGCLVLDIRMPGMSGMELAQQLRQQHSAMPIIFITGHGDVPMAVEAMKLDAIDFIQKPFRDQDLLDRIQQALDSDSENRASLEKRDVIQQRIQTLTPREREVMDMILLGKANKVIAIELSLSQRTVEIHRARVMEKMQVRSVAMLVRLVMEARREL